jgi:hypothetical protein
MWQNPRSIEDQETPDARLDRHLLSGERLLWKGRADPNRLFTLGDVFLIPFSLLWGGFAVFWESSVLGIWSQSSSGAPVFFVLWGVPFVVLGQYFIWGRFLYKRWDRRRTLYAVTNQRVLVLRGNALQSMFITQLPALNETTRPDGTGTLDFGNAAFGYGLWANTGMDWFARRGSGLAFYDITDVTNVHRLIADARSGQPP